MKKLVHSQKLEFFYDNATGEYGVAPEFTTEDNNGGDAFNASWGTLMIFHDFFEHYFENKNDYFKGKYANNVAAK